MVVELSENVIFFYRRQERERQKRETEEREAALVSSVVSECYNLYTG